MNSFASSKTDYVALQIRSLGSERINVQGAGPSTNRGYGVAVKLTAPPELVGWINTLKASIPSLAKTDAKYVSAQAAVRDGKIHFQVSGPSLNRGYGASFSDGNGELVTFVKAVLAHEEAEAAKVAAAAAVVKVAPVTKTYDITLG